MCPGRSEAPARLRTKPTKGRCLARVAWEHHSLCTCYLTKHDFGLDCDGNKGLVQCDKVLETSLLTTVEKQVEYSEKNWSTRSGHMKNIGSCPPTWRLHRPFPSATEDFTEKPTFLVVGWQTGGHQAKFMGAMEKNGAGVFLFSLSPLHVPFLFSLAHSVLNSTIEKLLISKCNIHVRLRHSASRWGVYRASVFLNKLPLRVAINPLLRRCSVSLDPRQC